MRRLLVAIKMSQRFWALPYLHSFSDLEAVHAQNLPQAVFLQANISLCTLLIY